MTNKEILSEIKEYSLSHKGKEVCGLILENVDKIKSIFKCKNISYDSREHCILSPKDYIKAARLGKIVAHFHSQEGKTPSFTDYLNAINHNIYSIVYSWGHDKFSIIEPKLKDYLNLNYKLGTNDCFSLVRNYYKNELNINIYNYNRYEKWELDQPNLILNSYEKEGFRKIKFNNIKINDIILFNIYGVPSHLAVYMGGNFILHHPENSQSVIDDLGEGLTKRINCVLRHKNF